MTGSKKADSEYRMNERLGEALGRVKRSGIKSIACLFANVRLAFELRATRVGAFRFHARKISKI